MLRPIGGSSRASALQMATWSAGALGHGGADAPDGEDNLREGVRVGLGHRFGASVCGCGRRFVTGSCVIRETTPTGCPRSRPRVFLFFLNLAAPINAAISSARLVWALRKVSPRSRIGSRSESSLRSHAWLFLRTREPAPSRSEHSPLHSAHACTHFVSLSPRSCAKDGNTEGDE
jgi:hypothetical protein